MSYVSTVYIVEVLTDTVLNLRADILVGRDWVFLWVYVNGNEDFNSHRSRLLLPLSAWLDTTALS